MKYSIHHATKAYNDAIRVYEAKLVQFGIPAEELGFQPLQTITSTMPAGLVSSWLTHIIFNLYQINNILLNQLI